MDEVKLLKEGDLREQERPVQRQREKKHHTNIKTSVSILAFLDDVCTHGNKRQEHPAGLVVVPFNKKKNKQEQ